jgi:hypothetical protein
MNLRAYVNEFEQVVAGLELVAKGFINTEKVYTQSPIICFMS